MYDGKVLPAANQSVVLHAEMEDGTWYLENRKFPIPGKKLNEFF